MEKTKQIFHLISYIQYPLIIVAVYYYALFILSISGSPDWIQLNNVLVFFGLSISISTLQDTSKTQNKISRKIWEHPKKGKIAILMLSMMALIFMASGLIGFLENQESIFKEMSFGLLLLGIGLIGMLKSATEMFEKHRKDRD